jgi:hypothetical protein
MGPSGSIEAKTGSAKNGETGKLLLTSGDTSNGAAGDITMSVGSSASKSLNPLHDGHNGGDILIAAGRTKDRKKKGGDMKLTGGEGSNEYQFGGGQGGDVEIKGGAALGGDVNTDRGGDVRIFSGFASHSKGGDLMLRSGYSVESDSGSISIVTPEAGTGGTSGLINIHTGKSHNGNSGESYVCSFGFSYISLLVKHYNY